jgi:hypothetical protein
MLGETDPKARIEDFHVPAVVRREYRNATQQIVSAVRLRPYRFELWHDKLDAFIFLQIDFYAAVQRVFHIVVHRTTHAAQIAQSIYIFSATFAKPGIFIAALLFRQTGPVRLDSISPYRENVATSGNWFSLDSHATHTKLWPWA